MQRLRGRLAASARLRHITQLPQHALDRLDSPLRRWVAVGVLLVLLTATGVAASAGFGTATAEDSELAGRPVPAGQVELIAAAAHSCPVLTPARLSGQLMAASGFDLNGKSDSGGSGLAGLTDAAWDKWKPRASSRRTDPAASITALAHLTCDLVGQVRQAGIGGDPWRLALGAYHSGIAAVTSAKGIPGPARGYVNRVSAYATWYARRATGGSDPAGPTGPSSALPGQGTPAKPVPDEYIAAVLAAGRTCPALSPARVAAQLMASSGFNPNLLGPHRAQGIAQFTPQLWARYAPSAAATSPWDPGVAVPALGRTMCTLLGEVAALGKDQYPMALAAFRGGPEAVQRAGGVPDSAELRDYVRLVTGYVGYYEQDVRLGGKPAGTPKPTATSGPSTSPRPGAGPSAPHTSSAPPPAAGGKPTTGSSSPARPPQTKPAAPPKPDWQTRVVEGTSVLQLGQAWTTNRLNFVLAKDGNVLLYDQGRLVWQTRTGGRGGHHLVFQADGHLVLYTQSNATLWSSGTAGNNGAILVLQADGNVTISLGGRGLWHTGTAS
ncbi:D-mannose binding lectin [Micromonospora pisi]|uniref:D-mannose binding lectin n=2 Tax=Micromonospora pisi TaxID=589240 RepID=A0A495JEC4_9ACTN|nr:D-mannose binding lectin [Micromonospora pisi]